ncbi:MAG: hypothetical protein H0U95_08805 [Bacteroidetes bacterium]|nr:hypothetical protein [Bacteroidota bacterium]
MPLALRSTKIKIFFLVFLYCIIIGFVSWNTPNHTGPHGGSIKNAGNYFIEIKQVDKFLNAYLLDKKLKNMNNKDILGAVKYFFKDSTTFDFKLQPTNASGFTCEGLSGFSVCKVTFTVLGNSVGAKFENTAY